MIEQLKNIWQKRELLYHIVKFQMTSENKNKVLGFAVAMHSDMDIVLIDEIMGAGDAAFRQKADVEMSRIIGERTVIIVSHSIPAIERFANKIIWLNKGVMAAMGEPKEVIGQYLTASKVKRPHPGEGDWAVA